MAAYNNRICDPTASNSWPTRRMGTVAYLKPMGSWRCQLSSHYRGVMRVARHYTNVKTASRAEKKDMLYIDRTHTSTELYSIHRQRGCCVCHLTSNIMVYYRTRPGECSSPYAAHLREHEYVAPVGRRCTQIIGDTTCNCLANRFEDVRACWIKVHRETAAPRPTTQVTFHHQSEKTTCRGDKQNKRGVMLHA